MMHSQLKQVALLSLTSALFIGAKASPANLAGRDATSLSDGTPEQSQNGSGNPPLPPTERNNNLDERSNGGACDRDGTGPVVVYITHTVDQYGNPITGGDASGTAQSTQAAGTGQGQSSGGDYDSAVGDTSGTGGAVSSIWSDDSASATGIQSGTASQTAVASDSQQGTTTSIVSSTISSAESSSTAEPTSAPASSSTISTAITSQSSSDDWDDWNDGASASGSASASASASASGSADVLGDGDSSAAYKATAAKPILLSLAVCIATTLVGGMLTTSGVA